MYRTILDYIRRNRLFAPGDRVIVAFSGGADSVCLLVVLHELRKELGLELKAVHVHHGLRGKEADRDSDYARQLSEDLGVPFACVRVDAALYAREHGMSVEEAGRHLRYQIFEKERLDFSGTKIAVAHHRDDQAETILYNLFRGTGLKGLGGMRPVRDKIVRPLLSVGREEILAYLAEKGISYCEDSTNAQTDYVRNRIRRRILPEIREEVNRRAGENILHAGEMAAQADAYLEKQAEGILKARGVLETDDAGSVTARGIDTKALLAEDDIIKNYVIRRMIRSVNESMKNITMTHVESAAALIFGSDSRQVDLPCGLIAVRIYDELWIKRKKQEGPVDKERAVLLPELDFKIFPYKKGQEIPKNGYTKWFDYDKIKCALSVRYRETGDYMTLAGGGRKTVKAFMIDEKIPKEERGKIPLVADGSHVLWVIGYRISEYYKITDDTHTVIQMQLNGGTLSGHTTMPKIQGRKEEKTMDDKIRILLSEEEVAARVKEIAEKISRDYEGKPLHLICILKGGVFFTCELAKRINLPLTMDFMSVSSYGAGTVSSGIVKITKDLDDPIEGKDVLIVEDIIDSGNTLAYLIEVLKQRNPNSIELCTLLDKPERRVKDQVKVKYTCFTVPDQFIIGYGLDYDQIYRNLPYIGVIEQQ